MAHFEEHSLISLAAQLQLLHRNNAFALSARQRRAQDDTSGLFASLGYLLRVNLAKYAMAEDEAGLDELRRHVRQFDVGLAEALFGETQRDADTASQVLGAMLSDQPRAEVEDRQLPVPWEFAQPTLWRWFYWDLSPQEESSETEFSRVEARHVYRFVKQRAASGDEVTPPLFHFVVGRFRDRRRKQLIDRLIAVASDMPGFYERLSDRQWIEQYHQAGGAIAVARRLTAALALCRGCETPAGAERLDDHLRRTVPGLDAQFQTLALVGEIAQESGITPELEALLLRASTEADLRGVLLRLGAPGGRPCTRTAQRLGCQLLRRYGVANFKSVAKFMQRIASLELESTLAARLSELLCEDKRLASQLLSGKLELAPLVALQRDSHDLSTRFLALSKLAVARLDGPRLGSVSRGLSLLMRMRRERKVDDRHYTQLMDAVTRKLPNSLLLLHELPDDLDARLGRLFVPLLVAIELYDENSGDNIEYLSDAYYQLSRHDRGSP